METPKVFISHASEDKDRFVMDFATKLMNNGVEAWVDKWEMSPGDSLIDKINQGLDNCDVFIIILSESSVKKPWVREELNTAIINRIDENTKLIPIIIDDNIRIPSLLKSIFRVTIEDLYDYDIQFNDIINAIFGVYNKPKLGNQPAYIVENKYINSLSHIDSLIFKSIYDEVFKNNETIFTEDSLTAIAARLKIPNNEFADSIEILYDEFYIRKEIMMGCQFPLVYINKYGALEYARHFIENYNKIVLGLISLISNGLLTRCDEYATELHCNLLLIKYLIEEYNDLEYVKTVYGPNGNKEIWGITAKGKRYFHQYLEEGNI